MQYLSTGNNPFVTRSLVDLTSYVDCFYVNTTYEQQTVVQPNLGMRGGVSMTVKGAPYKINQNEQLNGLIAA